MTTKIPLPIDSYLPNILKSHDEKDITVIQSSPGSGKTTRVPWEIFKKTGRKTIVLMPRKLPTKLATQRIAKENNITVGKEIGHIFRHERKISKETKLIFMTEGTFIKLLGDEVFQNELETVILDEFHERHLETDLAFGLLLKIKEKNSTLRLIIMSATLDLSLFQENINVIKIEAPLYEIKQHYLPNVPSVLNQPLHFHILNILSESYHMQGNVLIFLPGMKEILSLKEKLSPFYKKIIILHSEISELDDRDGLDELDSTIILSTNIAESSVTLPNIGIVIDSGIQRQIKYSPWNGLSYLEDVKTSQSSSIQRSARAGRTQDGLSFRLFSEFDFQQREFSKGPEILSSDLAEIYLDIKALNIHPIWLTPPNESTLELNRSFLKNIGAIDDNDKITSVGKTIQEIPYHPRVARCLIESQQYALGTQKNVVQFFIDYLDLKNDTKSVKELKSFLKEGMTEESDMERVLLSGFIDQCGKYRKRQNDFIHFSGKILKAKENIHLKDNELVIILSISKSLVVQNYVVISEEWLYDFEPFPINEEIEIDLDTKKEIILLNKIFIGKILLESTQRKITTQELKELYPKHLKGLTHFLEKEIRLVLHQPEFNRYHFALQTLSGEDLEELCLKNSEHFFEFYSDISQHSVHSFILFQIGSIINLSHLDLQFPEKIQLENNKFISILYSRDQQPKIECQIQELYGCQEIPPLHNGETQIILVILGPHKRPLQITSNLSQFWKSTYLELKKGLERDYPRHYWSNNPHADRPYLLKKHLHLKS